MKVAPTYRVSDDALRDRNYSCSPVKSAMTEESFGGGRSFLSSRELIPIH